MLRKKAEWPAVNPASRIALPSCAAGVHHRSWPLWVFDRRIRSCLWEHFRRAPEADLPRLPRVM